MTTELTPEHHTAISTTIHDELTQREKDLIPCFYSITGSYLYGTASPTSDVDIKGFHCAKGVRYMLFDQPDAQYTFQTQFESESLEFEVTSYELRTFGEMLEKSDFSIVELVTSDQQIYEYDTKLLTELDEIIQEVLPADLPNRYAGMARSLYERDVKAQTIDSQADAKSWVYALRGCLAAQYVQNHKRVEPKLITLAEATLPSGDVNSVRSFVSAIRNDNLSAENVGSDVRELIEEQLESLDITKFPSEERLAYRKALAEWMLDIRIATDTR